VLLRPGSYDPAIRASARVATSAAVSREAVLSLGMEEGADCLYGYDEDVGDSERGARWWLMKRSRKEVRSQMSQVQTRDANTINGGGSGDGGISILR
jgi:hypothetical protein